MPPLHRIEKTISLYVTADGFSIQGNKEKADCSVFSQPAPGIPAMEQKNSALKHPHVPRRCLSIAVFQRPALFSSLPPVIPFSAGSRCSTRNPPVSPQAGRTPPANNCRPARIPSALAAIATRLWCSRSAGFPAKHAENPLIIEWRKRRALRNLFDFQRFVQMLLDVIDGRLKPFCPALHFVCLLPLRSKYNSRKRFLSRHSVLLLCG